MQINTQFFSPKVETSDLPFHDGYFKFADLPCYEGSFYHRDLELKYAGKPKTVRLKKHTWFNPHKEFPDDGSVRTDYKSVYDGSRYKGSEYVLRDRWSDYFTDDLVGIRIWGIEKIARIFDQVKEGEVIRFSGVRDTWSWREIISINYGESIWNASAYGQKVKAKVTASKIRTLERELYSSENSLTNAIEIMRTKEDYFVPEKI